MRAERVEIVIRVGKIRRKIVLERADGFPDSSHLRKRSENYRVSVDGAYVLDSLGSVHYMSMSVFRDSLMRIMGDVAG